MPYMLLKSEDGWFVHKKNTDGSPGKRMNKKPLNRERAVKYLRALEVNVEDAELSLEPETEVQDEGLIFFKALPDDRWIAFYSNNFQDLTGEWFPEKGIDTFIQMVDQKQYDMPYLYFWHIPYPLGRADWIERIGHITAAVGHYKDFGDKEIFEKFRTYFAESEDLFMVSHGFLYNTKDKADDTYHRFLTFEISPIPVDKGVPANPLTVFKNVQEFTMLVVNEEKKAKLAEILGPDVAERFLALAEKYSDEISKLRMKYKEGETTEVAPVGIENSEDAKEATPQPEAEVPQTSEQPEAVVTDGDTKTMNAHHKPEDGPAQKDEEDTEDEDAGEEDSDEPKEKMDRKEQDAVAEVAKYIKDMSNQYTALEAKIKSMEESISGLSNFIRLQFGEARPATRSDATIVPENDPEFAKMKEKNLGLDDKDSTLANLLPMFFGTR